MLHSQKIKSERGRGRGEGRKRWNENEKVGQESGVEKVNNGRTERRSRWKIGCEHGRTLIYIEIKREIIASLQNRTIPIIVRSHLLPLEFFFILSIVTVSNSAL